MSYGPIQPRAQSVQNCRNASAVVDYCDRIIKHNSGLYTQPYGTAASASDLTSYDGEIAFQVVAPGYPQSATSAPYALTCLNAIVVRGRANPQEDVDTLQRSIRILGIVIATTVWNGANPSFTTDPVVVINGAHPTTNTGRENILAGDIILGMLPPVGRDVQVSIDSARSETSNNRMALETTPLRSLATPFADPCLVDFTRNILFRKMVRSISIAAIQYGVEIERAHVARGDLAMSDPAIYAIAAEALTAKMAYKVDRPVAPEDEVVSAISDTLIPEGAIDIAMNPFYKALCTKADVAQKPALVMYDIAKHVLNFAPYILSDIISRMVGIAQTPARPGTKFTLMTTPTAQSIIGRVRVKT